MKIALLGTRGIPANYGGFETFAEEVSARLVQRGHEVTVYCRSHYSRSSSDTYRGVGRVVLPTIHTKYLDTFVHTFLSCLHLFFHRQDVVLFCNGANAIFTFWPRLYDVHTVLNLDGLERQRRKWGRVARAWYLLSERWATLFPEVVISDARFIERYYLDRYGLQTQCIGYGTDHGSVKSTQQLEQLGLEPGKYFLYVSRFEPENNALLVVQEFEKSGVDQKLVMVGDAPYAAEYIAQVKDTNDSRILFTGAIYGEGYHELLSHSLAYIHATEVGGTHPALVEAMGRGAAVLYLDTPENREAAGSAGQSYTACEDELKTLIEDMASRGMGQLQEMREASSREARDRFNWEAVTDDYERLFMSFNNHS